MDNLPVHMRITSLTPTNEDVDARRAAIRKLSAAWGKITDVGKILDKAEMIAESLGGDGKPFEDFGLEVQEALQKHASAFLYTESPLDVGICAGIAALSILDSVPGNGGWTATDVYSNALWSALTFQPTLTEDKREKLRREVLDLAQKRSKLAADKARERTMVPDVGNLVVTIAEGAEPTTTFKDATSATIEALRRNAALDREELDFLWWVQLDRSRLLGRAFGGMAEPLRLVACGIEAASHLRRLPADLHYDLVLRTLDVDPELDLRELIEVIGGDRQLLAASFNSARVARHSSVFPLLHALATVKSTSPEPTRSAKRRPGPVAPCLRPA
ncbi:MAG: GTPase-associated system all-helical protein GASH [Nitrospira sp.]